MLCWHMFVASEARCHSHMWFIIPFEKKKTKTSKQTTKQNILVYVKDKSYAMLPIVLILEDKWPIYLQEKTSFSY